MAFHIRREATARLETSTVSKRNLLFTWTNSVMYPTEKGMVLETFLERIQDRLKVVFFENRTDRARYNWTELLRLCISQFHLLEIKLERVKYRLHVKFCRSCLSFYPSSSNFYACANGPLLDITTNWCNHLNWERVLITTSMISTGFKDLGWWFGRDLNSGPPAEWYSYKWVN